MNTTNSMETDPFCSCVPVDLLLVFRALDQVKTGPVDRLARASCLYLFKYIESTRAHVLNVHCSFKRKKLKRRELGRFLQVQVMLICKLNYYERVRKVLRILLLDLLMI